MSWSNRYLPYVTRIAGDPSDASVLYLGTAYSGLFKSSDAGAHWVDITHGISNPYIDGIAVDPDYPSVLTVVSGGGVFRSVNGGTSWIDLGSRLPKTAIVEAFARSPLDPQRFYAATIGTGGGHALRVVLPQGDANGDTKVDVLDVFDLINALFAGGAAPIGPADVNGDGRVDVADVFYLITYLFASGPPPITAS